MVRRKLVLPADLLAQSEAMRPGLKRYPAVDEDSFLRRVREFVEGLKHV